MAKMQEFKCPCCGGSIEFDSSVQKMKCPYCDTEFDVKTLSEYAQSVEEEEPEDMSWSDEAGDEWQEGESEGLRTYVCKSCGGEIVGDVNTAATACPFCGSPVVMTGNLSGQMPMQISAIREQRPDFGAIRTMIIQKPAIIPYTEKVRSVSTMCLWMVPKAWRMI